MLKDHANILAAPLTAIFNSSLREGVLPNEWKMANVIPLPKTKPMISVETDIRPISLTPIGSFHVNSTSVFHAPPQIVLKFGTVVEHG